MRAGGAAAAAAAEDAVLARTDADAAEEDEKEGPKDGALSAPLGTLK
jgi:hypothetical protein